jgi:hypothetical protein
LKQFGNAAETALCYGTVIAAPVTLNHGRRLRGRRNGGLVIFAATTPQSGSFRWESASLSARRNRQRYLSVWRWDNRGIGEIAMDDLLARLRVGPSGDPQQDRATMHRAAHELQRLLVQLQEARNRNEARLQPQEYRGKEPVGSENGWGD